jgi:DNA-binding GntR family transcriptional regulator
MHVAAREDISDLLMYRIRGEFREMPGLRLTIEQAARLWHIDAATCAAALMRLCAERFLTRTRHGAYVRLDQA